MLPNQNVTSLRLHPSWTVGFHLEQITPGKCGASLVAEHGYVLHAALRSARKFDSSERGYVLHAMLRCALCSFLVLFLF